MDSAASRRGLSINYERGKTEALWTIVGKGARRMKQEIHAAAHTLQWHSDDKPYTLQLCHAYKHLGTWIQSGHRHAKESLARGSAAKQQYGQIARSFFTKKSVTLPVKSAIFQSLVLSKMLYNVHTWTSVTQKHLDHWTNQLKAPVGTLLKGMLLAETRFQHSTDEMLAFAGILPLMDQVHANRLRFLARLLNACPQITWTLMHNTAGCHSWIHHCMDSCHWMLKHYDSALPLNLESTFQDWVSFVRLDANWKGRIRKTCGLATAYHRARAEHAIWQRHFEVKLTRVGAALPAHQPDRDAHEQWQCDLCAKTFASTRALAMHATREHGYKKKVRYFAVGDTCHSCCQTFHTRKRLSVHYEKQPKCYAVITACWPPMPTELVLTLDTEDREHETMLRKQGWWASKAFQPVVQTFGPALPPAGSEEARTMQDKMQIRRPSDEVAYTQLQGTKVSEKAQPPTDLWWTKSDLPAFIMQSACGRDNVGGALAMYGLARETAILHVRALVIVHFFSGYRRMGDLHHIVDHQVAEAGAHVFTISVDLCMQRQNGDLATHQASRWWRERVFAGQVVSAGGGPPCETFTVARQYEGGPRPLRSAQEPLGLPGLSMREWSQLRISDRLLRFLLDVLLALATMGLSGFLEHPQYPTWCTKGHPASIWMMEALIFLKNLACCAVVSFDQCVVGALGRKPTTLMLLRLPRVRDRLLCRGNYGRCNHPKGAHEALIGRQADGTFHTAKRRCTHTAWTECWGRRCSDRPCNGTIYALPTRRLMPSPHIWNRAATTLASSSPTITGAADQRSALAAWQDQAPTRCSSRNGKKMGWLNHQPGSTR